MAIFNKRVSTMKEIFLQKLKAILTTIKSF